MMAAWDLRALARALPALRPQLTLVVGEADRAVPPAQAREIAARVPGATVVVMPGLGHLAHEERPAEAAAVLRDAAARAGVGAPRAGGDPPAD